MEKSGIKSAIGRFFFFNYGRNLLAPGANSWIYTFCFLAVAMAVLEGLTWARILSVFMSEDLRAVAMVIGVIVAFAIYSIDKSYATLDTAPDYRKQDDEVAPPRPASGVKAWLGNKLLSGTLARLAIVAISMALTGPFLAQTLEERNVVQEIDARNARSIAVYRAQAGAAADAKIARVEQSIRDARKELERETAGRSISGKSGCGPTCKTMQKNIADLEGDLSQARSDKASRLTALATMSPRDLEKVEGVRILRDNADTRNRIRNDIEAGGGQKLFGFPASHVLASSLFMLLFMMMVLLKIYQPRTVAIYYNEHLQEAYERYVLGGFSDLPAHILEPHDRHDGPCPMGAQRFEAWYHDAYLPSSREKGLLGEMAAMEQGRTRAKARRCDTEAQLLELRSDKAQLEDRNSEATAHISQLEDLIMENESITTATRTAKLAAELELRKQKAREINDTLEALSIRREENGDHLQEAMAAIRQAEDRIGLLVGQSAHDARVQADPKLLALYAHRSELLEERRQIEIDVGRQQSALEAIGQQVGQVEAALLDTSGGKDGDLLFLDPDINALAQKRRELAERLATTTRERNHLEERIAQLEERIGELRAEGSADAEQDRKYMAGLREKEAEVYGAPFHRAA